MLTFCAATDYHLLLPDSMYESAPSYGSLPSSNVYGNGNRKLLRTEKHKTKTPKSQPWNWSYSLTLGPPSMHPFLSSFPDRIYPAVSVLAERHGTGNDGAGGIGCNRAVGHLNWPDWYCFSLQLVHFGAFLLLLSQHPPRSNAAMQVLLLNGKQRSKQNIKKMV